LLSVVVGVVTVTILFSQPAFVQQFRESIEKTYDGMIKAGNKSQAEADREVPVLVKVSPFLSGVSAVVVSFARIFWWAFVLWLLGLLFLKTKIGYLKAVEVAGLATMISVLGGIVALLLSVNFHKLSGANLDLLLGSSDPKSKLHPLLTVLDVFSFWLVGVMAAGLARLAGVRFARAFLFVAGYWLLLQFVLLSIGLLAAGLVSAAK